MRRREMRLTEALVARVPPHSGESGRLAGRSDLPTDPEYASAVATLLAGAPPSGEASSLPRGRMTRRATR